MKIQKLSGKCHPESGSDDYHESYNGNDLKEIGPAFPFLQLPPEIRLRIYCWAVGNCTIHVYRADKERGQKSPKNKLRHYFCRCRTSELEIWEAYAQPVAFKNRVDWHMRPREETMDDVHADCCPYLCWTPKARFPRPLNLGILSSSSEAHREAGRLVYSSNKWSFDDASVFQDWLTKVPRGFLPLIQDVHLQMSMGGSLANAKSSVAIWKATLSDVFPVELPGLKTLNLSIDLEGFVTCWRKGQSSAFTNIFRPLRQLKQIKEFTVVIRPGDRLEWNDYDGLHRKKCGQPLHDEDTHLASGYQKKAMFWERKELRRVWAEEIIYMVLGKK